MKDKKLKDVKKIALDYMESDYGIYFFNIGEKVIDTYNKLIAAGETDESYYKEAIKRHPNLIQK